MTLEQARTKRNELAAKMKATVAEIGQAADEAKKAELEKAFDAASGEFDKIDAQVKRLEQVEAAERRLGELRPSAGEAQLLGGAPRPGGAEAARSFDSFGEFMHAVRFRPSDQRLEWKDSGVSAEHRMDDGPSGGFMVPTQFSGELLSVEQSPAVVRPRARVIPAGSPADAKLSMPALDQGASQNMYAGVEVTWIGEGDEKPETNARLREIELAPKEVAAHVVVTDKLLRNWQAAGSFLSELLRKAIAAAEDDAFLRGSGVAKPAGILNSGAALALNRATANTVKYADLAKMESRLPADAIPVWLTTRRVFEPLRNMEDTEGHLIWTQGNAVEGRPSTLLGYPIIAVPRLPALGSKGDLMLVDLRYYLIKDGSGPFVAASEHVHFKNNKTVIKAFWNVDGQPWLKDPITDEDEQEYSPFVLLDVPAA